MKELLRLKKGIIFFLAGGILSTISYLGYLDKINGVPHWFVYFEIFLIIAYPFYFASMIQIRKLNRWFNFLTFSIIGFIAILVISDIFTMTSNELLIAIGNGLSLSTYLFEMVFFCLTFIGLSEIFEEYVHLKGSNIQKTAFFVFIGLSIVWFATIILLKFDQPLQNPVVYYTIALGNFLSYVGMVVISILFIKKALKTANELIRINKDEERV